MIRNLCSLWALFLAFGVETRKMFTGKFVMLSFSERGITPVFVVIYIPLKESPGLYLEVAPTKPTSLV